MLKQTLSYLLLICVLYSCTSTPDLPTEVAAAMASLPEKLDYNQHVKPILSDRCFACHGPDKGQLKAGLRLDIAEAAYAELPETPGKKAIVPGNLNRSELFHRIISDDPKYLMPDPVSHLTLSATEKATLIKWIQQGAVYKPHWAFIKPEKAPLPEIKDKALVKNPIDNFILQKLETKQLRYSPVADKQSILRRLSFDLIGLPPSIAEINAFVQDNSTDAYEKQVDRLLASKHFGERMAADWLDIARYADSHGYVEDRIRDMSPWRDWVIKAFNENLHYDDFIKYQLSGDLLPNPTKDQLIATAFNRNHQQNVEGGIVEEEFRVEYVTDRTNTAGQAFMALTVGCAKCHDHKFDPISQKDYYSLTSYFNNVREAGQISWDNATPGPTIMLPDEKKQQIIDFVNSTNNNSKEQLDNLKKKEEEKFNQWINDKSYKRIADFKTPPGLLNTIGLDGNLKIKPTSQGVMMHEGGVSELPKFVVDGSRKVLKFSGDSWFDTKTVGKFSRNDPFSIAVWINVPKALTDGVILHQGSIGLLYGFRGFHLAIKDNHLEMLMAHTAPYNAIIKNTSENIPRDQWIQLTLTYDASSKAAGYKVFLNAKELPTVTELDNLYKDITFKWYKGNDQESGYEQPALQFGGWERGRGLTNAAMKNIKVFDHSLTELEVEQTFDDLSFSRIATLNPESLSKEDKNKLHSYYSANISVAQRHLADSLKQFRKKYEKTIDSIPELMVMAEMPKPRQAYVLDRGQYDVHKDSVQPSVPKMILPMPNDYPKNRLGLAMWMVHPDHPLTSRVAVNRIWQLFFGRGLVKTSEDFGNQGQMPSHPELLDWLAVNFRESKWDVKSLIKMMVMSGAYRQSSVITEPLANMDPENILLSRGPSERLTAEMMRDEVLSASGLLNDSIGGRSVFPYQPDGLWTMNNAVYKQDSGSNLYRRSLYTIWKRSVPNPTLATFDIGIRTSCVIGRQRTNTPLQALIVLNDPTFVEAAKVMGEHMSKQTDHSAAVKEAFEKLSGRNPTTVELGLLEDLYNKQLATFKSHPSKMKGWLIAGQYKVDKKISPELIAANAVVASTIMNSDAAISKR